MIRFYLTTSRGAIELNGLGTTPGFAGKGRDRTVVQGRARSLREMPYGHEFYIADPDGHILAFLETK